MFSYSLERLRDLFEQAVADVPADDAPEFYIKYAKAEVISYKGS